MRDASGLRSFTLGIAVVFAILMSGVFTASADTVNAPMPRQGTPTSGIECDDGVDNDGDGLIDHPADTGCTNPNDDTEAGETVSPSATVTQTPTATMTITATPTPSPTPTTTPPATVTVTATPSPSATTTPSPGPTTPAPGAKQCEDGIDNDGDGKIDHPADPECENPKDDSEAPTPTVTEVPSAISIAHSLRPRHRFTGAVTSSDGACEGARRVVVKKVREGRDRVVGRDRTNDRGRWAVAHKEGGRGRYYAVVKTKSIVVSPTESISCLRGKSSRIRVRR